MKVDDILDGIGDLLIEIGRTYAPAMVANAKAQQAGPKSMKTVIEGQSWWQATFPFQVKCLQWINEERAKLDAHEKSQVDKIMAGASCDSKLMQSTCG